MTGKPRNHYTETYKATAVSRVENGETVSAVSKDLGIGYQTLWTWCQERGVSVRQKRGPYKKHERCPMCGSSQNAWRKEKLGLVDLNAVEPAKLQPVHFTPEETITFWDEDDREWGRYNPDSAGWDCSGCGYALMGGFDMGWFREDGSCIADYCPGCGHPIEQEPDILSRVWPED